MSHSIVIRKFSIIYQQLSHWREIIHLFFIGYVCGVLKEDKMRILLRYSHHLLVTVPFSLLCREGEEEKGTDVSTVSFGSSAMTS